MSEKEKENRNGQMGRDILAFGKMDFLTMKGPSFQFKILFIREIGKMEKLKNMESIHPKQSITKETGKKINLMDTACKLGQMDAYTRDNIIMEKNMDKVSINGLINQNM
jgi:hypothetical protein